MSGFVGYIRCMELICRDLACERFAPGDTVPPSWSAEADSFVLRMEAHGAEGFEEPSPECAAALLPRLSYGKGIAEIYERQMRRGEADPRLLEGLLIKGWRDVGEAAWRSGSFDQAD